MKLNFFAFEFFALGLVGLLILSLSGCIGSNSNSSPNNQASGVVTITSNPNVMSK
jgi:hypothetical protein